MCRATDADKEANGNETRRTEILEISTMRTFIIMNFASNRVSKI